MIASVVRVASAIQGKDSSMLKKVIFVLVLMVLAIGGSGLVYIAHIDQQNIDDAEQLKARVVKASMVLSARSKVWRKAVNILAKNADLIAILKGGSQELPDWIAAHKASADGMTMLRVARPGLMKVDLVTMPPLDYAGLELIRKAESSKKTQAPEVHRMGDSGRHIAIAAPILDGEQLLGVVVSSFDVTTIQKEFKSALSGEDAGWFILKQGSLEVDTSGVASHKEGSDWGSVPIVESRWTIGIRKQGIKVPFTQAELSLYVVCLVAIISILGALVGLLTNKKIRKKTNKTKVAVKESPLLDADGDLDKEKLAEAIKKKMGKLNEETVGPVFMKNDAIEVVLQMDVPQSIFRAYDIRGIVDETLTEQGVFSIGQAIASEALSVGQKTIAIARDGRLHSPRLSESLSKGIQSTGCHVIDVGQVPTPVLYFATHQLDTQSGVMITGSHNPANYNGLKIVIAGNTLSGDAIQSLYQRIEKGDVETGEGTYQEQMMLPEYIGEITSDVRLGRMMKVVVDCGNGVAGEAAPMLLSTLGCDVIPLYCEIDGNFPNHHPDPSKPENLQELIDKVREEEAELGLAFDGDGDRLGVVDSEGNIIWPDRQMMLYAIDVLSRQAGSDIIYDVKCTRNLAKVIAKHGGKPVMSQTGHSLIKAKMKETNAELAGEMSGHIFFKERWFGFDDALYTASRLLEILTAEFRTTAEIFAELPDSISTPELNISLEEGENFSFVEKLQSQAVFEDARVITIDGVRVEFKDGWGLVRASNTTPSLVLRFEADDETALERIKDVFREQMLTINADLKLPF